MVMGGTEASNSSIHSSRRLVWYAANSVYAFFFADDVCTGVATAAPRSNKRLWISLSMSPKPF